MGWQTDGRTGKAKIGSTLVVGFAMMRDRVKRLIAFEPVAAGNLVLAERSAVEGAVIGEDAFEADADHVSPTSPDPIEVPDTFWWVLGGGRRE